MATIPKKITERFSKELGKFQKILQTAKDRDVNESDTVAIIQDILSEIFGFDKYTEVTSEFAIRGVYCDLAIKVVDKVEYLIEAKAIGLNLKEAHLRQAIQYGATEGIPWVVLTNGIMWELHRIRFEKPVSADMICSFDFLELKPRLADDQEKLYLFCKEGLSKAAMDEYHQRGQTVNRFTVGAIVASDPVIAVIKRELKKLTPGLKVETAEIEKILTTEIFKREIYEGESALKAKSKLKKAANKAAKLIVNGSAKQNQEPTA